MNVEATLPALLLAVLGPLSLVAAQAPCGSAWQPGEGLAGLDGQPYAMATWDPDGSGPRGDVVVVGGQFRVAGPHLVGNIALYDPMAQQWAALPPLPLRVTSLLVRASGRLVAASIFGGVHEFDGVAWQPIGSANSATTVSAITELANGELVAGGVVQVQGSPSVSALARWNGGQWTSLGTPSFQGGAASVHALARSANGDLIVGGQFDVFAGVPCNHVVRWDGVNFLPLGIGLAEPVTALATSAAGEIVARCTPATGNLWRWAGAGWASLTSPQQPTNAVPIAAFGANGVLCRAVGGLFVHGPTGWSNFVSWSNSSPVSCAVPVGAGDAVVGGAFTTFEGQRAPRVAHWVAANWQAAGNGVRGAIGAALELDDGSLLVGGSLSRIGGATVSGLARFDGAAWSPFGPTATAITEIVQRTNGELVLAGSFVLGTGTPRLIVWQAGVATPLPLAANQTPIALVRARDDSVLVGVQEPTGLARVLRWDGVALQATPIVVLGALVDLVELPNGDVVVSGSFVTGTGGASVLRWDGGQWREILGAPTGPQQVLAVAKNGDLLVGGDFTAPGTRIARWDGASWQSMGALAAPVVSIDSLPNGDVVVAERVPFGPGQFVTRIQRFDGVGWFLLGELGGAAELAWTASGTLVVFGDFARIGSQVSASLGRLAPVCPSDSLDLGGGCSGSDGPVRLRVTERAWVGASTGAATTGIPANALALGVFGAGAVSLPLAQVLPIAGAGCTLRAAPDLLLLLPVANGEASVQWVLPSAPALVGLAFTQQTVVLESAAGVATLVTSSNAVQLSVGSF